MRIRQVTLPILIVLYLSLVACTDEGSPSASYPGPVGTPAAYSYRAYDSGGSLAIVGTLTLVLADSAAIGGTWTLEQVLTGGKVGPQVGTGKLAGTISGTSIWVNLNPNWADNNVFLQGTIDDGRISGKWMWSTFVGNTAEGTFEAVEKQ
jgi:hypothetical protein